MMFAGAKRTNKGLLALVATAGALCAVFCILPSYRNQKSVLLSGRAGAVESMKKSARQLEKEGFVDQARALMKEASQLEKVKKAERYPQRSSYNQQSRLAAQNFPSGRRGGGFTPSKVWTYAPNWLPMHSGFQFSQRRQVMRPSFARPAMAWSSLEEGPAEEVIEEPVPRAVVASGLPPAHDGAWGSSFKKNAGGNEEAMRKAGINYDDYPLDVYRSIPYMTFDPTVGTEKEFKAKIPASKEVVSPYTLKHGRNKGGDVMPAGWGVWNEGGVGEDRLRAQGVHVDRWPMDFYAGFPNPAWDGTEFDQARRIPKAPVKDAKAAVERHRESQKRIESAGVKSNGIPWEPETTKRNYNSVSRALLPFTRSRHSLIRLMG
eukprot:746042-Hanusia_phi.AAC.4